MPLRHLALTWMTVFQTFSATASGSASSTPLNVDESGHIVVMEYESLYGPDAQIGMGGLPVHPVLSSGDMDSSGVCVGGGLPPCGYDSGDPAIIRQHVAWLEALGADAATIDLSNNAPCTFDTPYPGPGSNCNRSSLLGILSNGVNLYSAWTRLGTRLKLIPLIDAQDEYLLVPDSRHMTALEHQVLYLKTFMRRYPNMNVIYEGKPLMILYGGASPCVEGLNNPAGGAKYPCFPPAVGDTSPPEGAEQPTVANIMGLLQDKGYTKQFTFKVMGGYFDAQWPYWANPNETPTAPVQMNPKYPFWSWVDRLLPAPPYGYFPTYVSVRSRFQPLSAPVDARADPVASDSSLPAAERVESFTASVATASALSTSFGWAAGESADPSYAPDDSLRRTGEVFRSFMAYAARLNPIFLFIHQFNEYSTPDVGDEGWDANTTDGIEPTNVLPNGPGLPVVSGTQDYFSVVQKEIAKFKEHY